MEPPHSIIVFGIFVLQLLHDELTDFQAAITGSICMKWSPSIEGFGVLVLQDLHDELDNLRMTNYPIAIGHYWQQNEVWSPSIVVFGTLVLQLLHDN